MEWTFNREQMLTVHEECAILHSEPTADLLSFLSSTTTWLKCDISPNVLSSFASRSPAMSLGFTILCEIFASVTVFNPTTQVVTFRLRRSVVFCCCCCCWFFVFFFAGIHSSRT